MTGSSSGMARRAPTLGRRGRSGQPVSLFSSPSKSHCHIGLPTAGRGQERSKTMFLRTHRLFLRPAWPEDAAELTRAIGHEPVVRMLSRVPWPYQEEHARTWIDAPRDAYLPNLLITLP